jgi:uncharacterized protein YcsI (UPF0317 family)
MVSFLLGCSYTLEQALLAGGVPVRHFELGRSVAMYRTSWPIRPVGRFTGNLVVSLRAMPAEQVGLAARITGEYPEVHGGPIHVGDPAVLGIKDLGRPDYGDPPVLQPGDVPVFWECAVTPQAVVQAAKLPFAITQAPGHMLVTDRPLSDFKAGA